MLVGGVGKYLAIEKSMDIVSQPSGITDIFHGFMAAVSQNAGLSGKKR